MHSFEPADPWEVDTPHGCGVVLYVTVYGAYSNDLFCVANKEDGRIRHYQTDQIRLTRNWTLGVNVPAAVTLNGHQAGVPAHANGHAATNGHKPAAARPRASAG
jgi:hypothetical protein